MVIFNSYVSLPEGNAMGLPSLPTLQSRHAPASAFCRRSKVASLCDGPPTNATRNTTWHNRVGTPKKVPKLDLRPLKVTKYRP
jgi:hypothetical protein